MAPENREVTIPSKSRPTDGTANKLRYERSVMGNYPPEGVPGPSEGDVVRFGGSMDLHRLAAERSLAFHRVVANRLLQDPAVLEKARGRVRTWIARTPARPFARDWEKVLAGGPETVAAFLVSRSELAQELRQSSPFAGVLDARERWRIWRETRRVLAGER